MLQGAVGEASDDHVHPLDALRRRPDPAKGVEFESLSEEFLRLWFGASRIRKQEPDLGVDRVFTDRNGRHVAVQMKAYGPDRAVSYGDLTKFVNAAEVEQAEYLILLTTTDKISRHAMKVVRAKGIVVLGYDDLITVDCWAGRPPAVPPPLNPFPFQREAIAAALEDVERCQIVMPTGSGKSLVQAELAKAHSSVLQMVPSIELVRQMVGDLRRQDPTRTILGVVSRSDFDDYGLPVENTTDAEYLRGFLQTVERPVVVATYASGPTIVEGSRGFTFDLVIYDEAHRTAGAGVSRRNGHTPRYKLTLTHVAAKRRRFFTATPRIHADALKDWAEQNDAVAFSMDDPAIYGDVRYAASVKDMIELGRLSPFDIAIGLVSDESVLEVLNAGGYTDLVSLDEPDDLDDVAAVLHLLRAAELFGLRRILTFHSRIESASRAVRLIGRIGQERGINVRAVAVDARSPRKAREQALAMLKDPASDVIRVVCNVKLFAEGVNTPALDAVAYFDPKSSVIDITQSIGRALRVHPDKERAYLLLPVYVGAAANAQQAVAGSDFRTIANVGSALRDMGVIVMQTETPSRRTRDRVVTRRGDDSGFRMTITGVDVPWDAWLMGDAMESLIVDGYIRHPTDRKIDALTPQQFRTWGETVLADIVARAEELTDDEILAVLDSTVPGE